MALGRASPRPPTGSTNCSPSGPPRSPATGAIAQVGTIASRDELIGDLLGEALEKVGADGVVTVEEHSALTTELEITDGVQFDKGYISPYFADRPGGREAVLENAHVLLGREKISRAGRPAAAAGEGARRRQAAADRGRGRRGRGAVHPGGQRHPQDASGRRGQVAVLRRPPQGVHAGPGDRHRRRGGLRRGRAQAGRGRARGAGHRPPGHRHQGRHHDRRRRRATRTPSPAGVEQLSATSRTPIPTGTGRSCRSGWPSWPAASR